MTDLFYLGVAAAMGLATYLLLKLCDVLGRDTTRGRS